MSEKVVLGMSGGVDSSVAAYLLKQQGYEVIGVTMQVWHGEGETCRITEQMIEDAERIAKQLGVEHHVINMEKQFNENVSDYFISSYIHGETPNPCVICNRKVKWEALREWAKERGATKLATGHYAHILQLPNGRYTIKMADALEKDQTYVLFRLTQEQLANTIMPIGSYHKDRVREIAEEIGMQVAQKPDSMEICFIPDNDYVGYIKKHYEGTMPPKGNFVDESGKTLGQHQGIANYTVGQRKGLGIALGKPVYVTEIRPDTNEVVLGDDEDVFSSALLADDANAMGIEAFDNPFRCRAKIRYAHRGTMATCTPLSNGQLRVDFDEPVRAVTPGQSVVFYEEDYVLGGAKIIGRLKNEEGNLEK